MKKIILIIVIIATSFIFKDKIIPEASDDFEKEFHEGNFWALEVLFVSALVAIAVDETKKRKKDKNSNLL